MILLLGLINLKIRLRTNPLYLEGVGERTGDTLLIKCLEYLPPKGGVGASIELDEKTQKVTSGGEYTNIFGGKQDVKAGDTVVTGYSNLRMNITDANSRMSRDSKIK